VRLFRECLPEGCCRFLCLDARADSARSPHSLGEAESKAFCCVLLRGLVAHGLAGVAFCVLDVQKGLKKALAQMLGRPGQKVRRARLQGR
jgi:hypothetical protein